MQFSTEDTSGMAFKPSTFSPFRSCGNAAAEQGGAGASCSDAVRSGSLKSAGTGQISWAEEADTMRQSITQGPTPTMPNEHM